MLRLDKLLLWRLGLGLGVLISLIGLGSIWFSGRSETRDAFESGRRLLIALESGNVEGKHISTQPKPPSPVTPEPSATSEPSAPPVNAELPPANPEPTTTPPADTEPPPAPAASSPPAIEPATSVTAPATPSISETKPLEAQEIISITEEVPELSEAEANAPSIPSSNPPQAVAAALTEKSDTGTLPIIGKDGTKPWRYYAKPFERKGSQPVIAIIVTGLGYNKSVTNSALKLSENITLSFSPYARNIESWATSARVAGHETLIDLPMEPGNYPAVDPGPYGLLIGKGLSENERRLRWLMARFPGYIGFLTPQNEVYSGNEEAFRALLQSLANRGLMMAVGREPYKTEIKTMMESSNTAVVIADTLIDEELMVSSIQSRLTQLEQIAQKRGYAVGIAQALPITIEQLRLWSDMLADKGIVLAPVSAIAHLRFS
jgi:uncharacterized protein